MNSVIQISKKSSNSLLIICDSFPPYFAPRMGSLARYLKKKGWQVFVVSTRLWDNDNLYAVANLEVDMHICVDSEGLRGSQLGLFYRTYLRLSKPCCEDYLIGEKMKIVSKQILDNNKVDIILSSTACSPFLSFTANSLSKEYNIPWICDYRDLYEQEVLPKVNLIRDMLHNYVRRKMIKQRNKLLKKCNAVTVVSNCHLEIVNKHNKSSYLVMNGYDKEIYFPREPVITDRFIITYGGKVYKNFSDSATLFEGVDLFLEKYKVNENDIALKFYVDSQSKEVVIKTADRYISKKLVTYYEKIISSDYVKVMAESSLLIVLSSPQTKGILTTKFFEYIALHRPVLLVKSDNGDLHNLMNVTNAGVSATCAEDVAKYLNELYKEWLMHGYTKNRNVINAENYSRECSNHQFESILSSYCKTV